jgi:hypothetical protein
MKFHWPSFLLGCAAGAAGVLFAKQLRPIVLELATAAYEISDAIAARAATWWEDVDDAVAEARARARPTRSGTRARARG